MSNRINDVVYLRDVKKGMIKLYLEGGDTGITTFYDTLDPHFTFLKRDVTVVGGIGNHGKSTWFMQLALLQTVNFGTKWAIFSPEQYPPTYFYNDLIHTYSGKNVEFRYKKNRIPEKEYQEAMDFIERHFFYIYPESEITTPAYIFGKFEEVIKRHGVDGCITDPFNQLVRDWEQSRRDDRYVSDFLQEHKRFANKHNVYDAIIAHPKGRLDKDTEGNYSCPAVLDLAGGAMWNNHADNIIFVHRPYFGSNPADPTTLVRVAKIKKQRLVGIPGDIDFSFDFMSNRYTANGQDPFSKKAYQTEFEL